MNRQTNISEARNLLTDIAVGEDDLEAKRWRLAELAAEAVADGMSRREYAAAIGKSESTVRRWVITWAKYGAESTPHRPRFADAYATVETGSDELVTRTDVGRRTAERQVPTRHDDRVEMAAKLLDDPEVAKAVAERVVTDSSLSNRLITQTVLVSDAAKRRKSREQAKEMRQMGALPMAAHMSTMMLKMHEWAGGLAALIEDLDDLPEGRSRELVLEAARHLAKEAQRWVDRLEGEPNLRVIELAAQHN